jgi:hypothetical protein
MKNKLKDLALTATLCVGMLGFSGCATPQQTVERFRSEGYMERVVDFMTENPEVSRETTLDLYRTALNGGVITPGNALDSFTPHEKNAALLYLAGDKTPKELDSLLGGLYTASGNVSGAADRSRVYLESRVPSNETDADSAFTRAREIVESHLKK